MEAIHDPTQGDLIVLMKLARELLRVNSVKAALKALWDSLQFLSPDDLLLTARCNRRDYCFHVNATGTVLRIGQKSRRLIEALGTSNLNSNTQTSQMIQLPEAFVITAAFTCGKICGRIALSWKSEPDQAQRAAMALPGIADLTGARLEGLIHQDHRESQLSAQCDSLVATQIHHEERLRTCELENTEARALATVDQLTGLQNRRGFLAKAEQCLILAQRQMLACAVIFVDVDGLKEINDRLGHAAGDALICCAGSMLSSALRHADVVARVGGDEFAAFTFDNASPTKIIDRISDRIAEFNAEKRHPFTLSLSIGVVICNAESNESLSEYLARADSEMYIHKRERQQL
ncbi:GGDEF domain-containing protein [Massilia sp. BJB1822]|uniref:GGDEF domain-containing protein n=1 Tax=Massilia sp. BJB1822 TaxID=2744470 RepID=UPI001592DA08|nr:GGDEF domain-containing protein [Massilia sp. BJB1822]NVD97685.1 GGDEF domain-containing protein [Massilia sp. BJB1822]